MFNVVSAQWILQNSETTAILNSVFFTDIDTGFAVGSNGVILRTLNGGNNWTQQNTGVTEALHCVHFPSRDIGYVIGDSSVLKTINGGLTWQSLSTGYSSLKSVYFTSNDTGYIAGVNRVLKTIDGGSSWNTVVYDIAETFNSIYFPEKEKGTVVGQYWHPKVHYIICNTENGGLDWACQGNYSPETEYYGFASVQFPAVDVGYAIGSILFKSSNGVDWDLISDESGNSVFFITPDVGYIAGQSGKIKASADGGYIWVNQFSGTAYDLNSVFFVNEDIGYIVGNNGTIMKTNNGGFPVGVKPTGFTVDKNLVVFLNPYTNTLTIELEGEKSILIFDMNGRVMDEIVSKAGAINFDLNDYRGGVYFLKIIQSGSICVKKIVKQ